MSEANKALARRWFNEVWNNGNSAVIQEMYHPLGRLHGFPEPDGVLNSPDEFKIIYDHFRETFSNIQIVIDELIAEDNKVAVRWTACMTHTGFGLGFAPTGERASLSGASVLHFKGGYIFEGWNYLDLTKLRADLKEIADKK